MDKPRKIILWGASVTLAAGLSALAVWWFSDPNLLRASKDTATTTDTSCSLNQDQYFGFAGWGPHGSDLIKFTGARLVGVQDGLIVKGVYAVSSVENPGKPLLATGGADAWQRYEAGVKLHPVSDAVVDPRSTSPGWWLVAVVQQTKPGPQSASGLVVDYSVGGRSGSTKYNYVSVSDCKP